MAKRLRPDETPKHPEVDGKQMHIDELRRIHAALRETERRWKKRGAAGDSASWTDDDAFWDEYRAVYAALKKA